MDCFALAYTWARLACVESTDEPRLDLLELDLLFDRLEDFELCWKRLDLWTNASRNRARYVRCVLRSLRTTRHFRPATETVE
jgi:hypothetical protein